MNGSVNSQEKALTYLNSKKDPPFCQLTTRPRYQVKNGHFVQVTCRKESWRRKFSDYMANQ